MGALLLPAVQSAREGARRIQCVNNLKQVGIGIHQYIAVNGDFPAGQGSQGRSLFVQLLPALEQSPLFNAINESLAISCHENYTSINVRLSILVCPSDVSREYLESTHYAGNVGEVYMNGPGSRFNGVFLDSEAAADRYIGLNSVQDGTSNTAAAAEWLVGGGGTGGPQARTVFAEGGRKWRADEPRNFRGSVPRA